MTRAPVAEDILVLDHAARDDEVRGLIGTSADVERLWEVCQIPDYRKIAPATHAELAVTLYGFLRREGKIPIDWFAKQVALADRTDGDIDTLSNRIAHIRTWTFAANRPDWLADPEHWQGVTRGVEDKLSDALHERLAERFIDRRTSVLMRRLRENAELEPEMSKTGEVVVEGHTIGRLDGFVFVPDASSGGSEAKALQNAAQKALVGEIAARATRLAEAPDQQFVLAADGTIRWTGAAVGKLVAGEEALRPRVRVIADEHLSGAPREAVEARLETFVKSHITKLLGSLFELSAGADINGIARGVAFQLVEALGVLERTRVADEVKGLDQPERANLRKYGVRFGAYHIYLPLLLKPAPRALAVQLWALSHDGPQSNGLDDLLHLAGSGRTSIPANIEIDAALYRTAGYRVCGERAVRVDILERLADLIRPALAWREGGAGQKPPGAIAGGGFTVVNTMTSLTGASGEDFASILRSLGYRMEKRSKPAEPVPAAEAPVTVAAENVDAPPTDPVAVALTPSPNSPMLDEIGATGEEHRRYSRTVGCAKSGRPTGYRGCRWRSCAQRRRICCSVTVDRFGRRSSANRADRDTSGNGGNGRARVDRSVAARPLRAAPRTPAFSTSRGAQASAGGHRRTDARRGCAGGGRNQWRFRSDRAGGRPDPAVRTRTDRNAKA